MPTESGVLGTDLEAVGAVALAVVAQDVEKTLEEAEVEALASKIVETVSEKLGASLRS